MKKNALIRAAMVLAVAGLSTAASAQVWNESGDAGQLLPGQAVLGTTITGIAGSFTGGNDVDLYQITVTDWSLFSADLAAGSQDTQIYLFDPAGNGIAFNDDAPFPFSRLPVGNALYAGRTNGEVVFIGVSLYDNDPVNGAAVAMFPDSPFTSVLGPVAAGPLAGWTNTGTGSGAYALTLTGVAAVPAPGAAALLGLGGLVGLRRRR